MARLKEIREALRLKQAELAEKIGKSQTTISDIEKEKYPIDKTISLAIQAAFGVNSEWLLDGKEPKFINEELAKKYMENRLDINSDKEYLKLNFDVKNIGEIINEIKKLSKIKDNNEIIESSLKMYLLLLQKSSYEIKIIKIVDEIKIFLT